MLVTPPRSRPEEFRPRAVEVGQEEFNAPTIKTVFKVVWNAAARLFHDPIGMLLGSAFVLIMLWGQHGKLEWVGTIWSGWKGPGSDPAHRTSIIPGIPWDQEWLSFAAGVFLLVIIPILLIRFVLKQNLRDYGLWLPPPGRRKFAAAAALLLFGLSLPAFFLGANTGSMQDLYPLFRGDFDNLGAFALYQVGYLLFFVVIEFIFRGYLLFGLFQFQDRDAPPGVIGVQGPQLFGYYAIFISMLSYTAWHLGKPIPELWGTLFWGIAAGAVALASQSIVFLILIHWLLNVFLDLMIWQGWTFWRL